MKETHYTEGYGGNYNYSTACGKEIHSHNEFEDATVDPLRVTCPECKKTKEHKQDMKDNKNIYPDIKRRIFIESDFATASDIQRNQRQVSMLLRKNKLKHVRRVFSEILDRAWHNLDVTWGAVKKADEIYADSSLLPLCGGSYMGAPVIFNGMCERAVKEGVSGKDVYILNELKNINWYMIDMPLMKKAFANNNLYMYNDKWEIVKIDVTTIKK